MNRKMELLIGSLILILIIGFIGVKSMDSFIDRDKNLVKLEKALIDKDIDYLKKYTRIENLDRDLKKEEIKDILDNLDEDYIEDLKYSSKNDNIYFLKDGKDMFIFDKYYLVLKPYELVIESSYDNLTTDTKVIIDGKEVGRIKKDDDVFRYKNILPGKHIVRLEIDGEYARLEKEEEILALNLEGNSEVYVDGYIDYTYIDVESNLEEAKLYINGKNTDISIHDMYRIEPLNEDTELKLKAVAKIDGKVYESKEVNIKEGNHDRYYNLYIEYSESGEDRSKGKDESKDKDLVNDDKHLQLSYFMENYQNSFVSAVNENSYLFIQEYIEDGSTFMKTQQDLIKNLNKKNIKEELISFSIDKITENSESQNSLIVTEKHKIFYGDGTSKNVENRWEYIVIQDDYRYFIRDLKKAN